MHGICSFLDPRFKNIFATDQIVFLGQIESWLKALKNYEASNFERNNNGAEEQYEMVEIIERPSSPPTKRACFFDDAEDFFKKGSERGDFFIIFNHLNLI